MLEPFSRRVVGYAISAVLNTELTVKALVMAIAGRQPEAGVIRHSDHGVQYASAGIM